MSRFPIDEEEMARRQDEDLIALLKMVGEGGPSFYPFEKDDEDQVGEKILPETYQ